MEILKEAVAGTLESSDCFVMVRPDRCLEIDIESIVLERYGKRIRQVVEEIISEMEVENGHFKIQDRGALDYCIRARMRTAIRRAGAK
ncbi:MAG: hypothetical protein PWR06_2508 [Thermoanaerobacteraceae bacterium]|nr:hypothetical protein [Thermoanaerobacteraceae bacterium]